MLAVGFDTLFASFCRLINMPELAQDDRYQKNAGRVVNRDTLIPLLVTVMKTRKRDAWLADLEANNIPAGPINTIDQVYADPQVVARQMKLQLPHPAAGTMPMTASPMRFSDTPIQYRNAPPMLGQHSEDILRQELGWSNEQIAALLGK
ncbi:MAG: CoA transferase [Advenella sp.]